MDDETPRVEESPSSSGWRHWLARVKTRQGMAGCVLAAVISAGVYLHPLSPDRNKPGETVEVEAGEFAKWTQEEDFARIKEVAFSQPPGSLYEVAGLLVEDHSPQALKMLRQLCATSDGALAVAETAEQLPLDEALALCRDLTHSQDDAVRQGAICTLFFLAAAGEQFNGPWPEGMARPVETASERARWQKAQREEGEDEGFAEWRYKNAVTAFVCSREPASRLGALSEEALLRQLDTELRKRFQFELKP